MRFEEALKAMREGKRVRCEDYRIFYVDEWEDIREDNPFTGAVDYPASFISTEIMSENWEIVDDRFNREMEEWRA